jgi:hypothetical protein
MQKIVKRNVKKLKIPNHLYFFLLRYLGISTFTVRYVGNVVIRVRKVDIVKT